MTILADLLHQQIASSGPISVSAYMRRCLMDPDHGYYTTSPVFGAEGDFITAPEISQLFGEMLAAFQAHIHQLFGAPEDCILLEAGAGRGTLLHDMHRAYRQIAPTLYQAPCYLLEQSPAMQALQSQALAPKTPQFLHTCDDLPHKPLFAVANEFFDALGVDQIIYHKGQWHDRLITSKQGQFQFHIGPAAQDLSSFTPLPAQPSEGDILETSPDGRQMMARLAKHIAHFGGALLIIDYGKTDNIGDSLQAVRHHKPTDILSYQGEADITHWVDFGALARIASENQARLIGPVAQGRFLTDLGIASRAEALRKQDDPDGDRALLAAIDRLVSPAQMGHAFKVSVLVPQGDGTPPGFTSLQKPSSDKRELNERQNMR
ncbi:MAG: class I SAM-dependent methyltransferase [Candidatus Puniceispirillaceae bacterium]